MHRRLAHVGRARRAPQISRAGPADTEALCRLKDVVVDASWGRDYSTAAVCEWKARFASPSYFAERLVATGAPLTYFFLAGSPELPCGMIAVKARGGRSYVGDLYVRTPGRGIGRQLLRHATEQGHALGLGVAIADVFEGNARAYRLFVSEGFSEEDQYLEASLGIRVLRLSQTLLPRPQGAKPALGPARPQATLEGGARVSRSA